MLQTSWEEPAIYFGAMTNSQEDFLDDLEEIPTYFGSHLLFFPYPNLSPIGMHFDFS